MTPYEANHYFETLPEGFAPAEELRAALPAAVQQVQFVGVAGTAGKTATAGLLGAILQAAGFVTGLYHAGCEPLAARIRVQGAPVDEVLFCEAAEKLSAAKPLPRAAAELAAAAICFGAAGCKLAVVELPDAGLAAALPALPVCAVTAIGPDGISRSVERSAALAAGVMREGSICVTAPEQPKAVLSELIVAAGKCNCELVVPDPEEQKKDKQTMPGMGENPFDQVFLVTPSGVEAALTERLLEKARYHFDAVLCESLDEAVKQAKANSRRGLLVCGSEAIALEAAKLLETI